MASVGVTASRAMSLVMPHAGYRYCGRLAARAAASLATASYSRVIIIGPSHYQRFAGLASSSHHRWRTPLGDWPVDLAGVQALLASCPAVRHDDRAHAPEHAIEVLLPWLWALQPQAKLLPLLCGDLSEAALVQAGAAMARLCDEHTLLVISSDFTHFGQAFGYCPFSVAEAPQRLPELDLGAIGCLETGDRQAFEAYVANTGATICGQRPLALLLDLQRQLGQPPLHLLQYGNSASQTHDYRQVVGYAAMKGERLP